MMMMMMMMIAKDAFFCIKRPS